MRSLSPHPRDNSIRCLRVGSDDAVRKCVDHPAPVICHAVSHSHVTEITLFITSLVTLGRAAVNCYDRTWGALQPLHYPSPSPLCSPWVCLIQCFGPQWLSIPVMFTFCVRHLYAQLMSVTLLLSSHNREE